MSNFHISTWREYGPAGWAFPKARGGEFLPPDVVRAGPVLPLHNSTYQSVKTSRTLRPEDQYTRLEPSLLAGRITSRLLYMKDIGLIDFMKRIQMDRVYRSFETGLFSGSSPDSRCSGYLKDRSVSIKFINSLVKEPTPVSVEVGRGVGQAACRWASSTGVAS